MAITNRAYGYQGVIASQPVADALTGALAATLFVVLLPDLTDMFTRRQHS